MLPKRNPSRHNEKHCTTLGVVSIISLTRVEEEAVIVEKREMTASPLNTRFTLISLV